MNIRRSPCIYSFAKNALIHPPKPIFTPKVSSHRSRCFTKAAFLSNSSTLVKQSNNRTIPPSFYQIRTISTDSHSPQLSDSFEPGIIFYTNGKNGPENSPDTERLLNIGKNTDILIEELANYFVKGLTQSQIYSSEMILKEQFHSNIHIKGRSTYVMFSNFLRQCLLAYFHSPSFIITKVRQGSEMNASISKSTPQNSPDPLSGWEGPHVDLGADDNSQDEVFDNLDLLVYWNFEGTSRLMRLLWMGGKVSHYTGLSLYRFDLTGNISEHIVLRIFPSPKPRFLTAFRNKWASIFYPKETSLA